MKNFKDKVAVVTGGASGIGRALAKAFLENGAKVCIADVEQAALEKTAGELSSLGTVTSFVTDVRKPESLDALADHVYGEFGACHVLCNNAGVGVANLNTWDTEPSDWTWVFGVNVEGVVNGTRAFVPRMIAGGEEGFVMNTSSGDGGISPLPGQVVYASSKAAVSILTECTASTLKSEGTKLRAGILYPSGGVLDTGIWTTKRNRPSDLQRKSAPPAGSEQTLEEFKTQMDAAGIELPFQDLDELAAHALEGIKNEEFVIMIGRESMEETLVARAKALARGECPVDMIGHG